MRTGRDGLVTQRDIGDRQVRATAINNLRSDNFVTGESGWQITKAGDAEFQDVTVRGIIYASEGSVIPAQVITGFDIHEFFGAEYVFPGRGDTLPATADEGDLFFLTTDNKLYRYDGAAWVVKIGFDDLTGYIAVAQIDVNTIYGSMIVAGEIGAGHISVTDMAAINTKTGNLWVAGTVTMGIGGDTGYIQSNDYDATHGWQMAPTGLTIHVGTIDAAAIKAGSITGTEISGDQLDVVAGKCGTLQVDEVLTLAGSGVLETVGGYSVGGAVKAVTITAAGPDRLTFYSGGNLETAAGFVYGDNATNAPYLRIQGPVIAGPASGRIDLWGTAVDITHTTGVRLQLGGVSKMSVTASEISAALDVNPATDNARNLGSDTTSWLGLYAYNLKDEAGVTRWDLSADLTMAAGGSLSVTSGALGWKTAAGVTAFEVAALGANPCYIYVGSSLRQVTRSATAFTTGEYPLVVA